MAEFDGPIDWHRMEGKLTFDAIKEFEALLHARQDQRGSISRINEEDAVLRLEEKIRADERAKHVVPEATLTRCPCGSYDIPAHDRTEGE